LQKVEFVILSASDTCLILNFEMLKHFMAIHSKLWVGAEEDLLLHAEKLFKMSNTRIYQWKQN